MKKNYVFILFVVFISFAAQKGFSQNKHPNASEKQKIEGLSIYPNPASNGHQYIYISSKKKLNKNVKVYNALGRQILSRMLVDKALDISGLNTGIYILKISENNITETRKLVIK